MFVPYLTTGDWELAVPATIRADGYELLPRCWVLERIKGNDWKLVGKSVFIGGGGFVDTDIQGVPAWKVRDYEKVYGRIGKEAPENNT